jgi:DNA polymerase-3 subunit epsilon
LGEVEVMNKKIFWFDVETTGKDPKKQDIIQLGFIIEIDGEIKESGNIFIQPFNYDTIEQEALDVNRRTIEEIKTFPTPQESYNELIGILEKYVDRFNKEDKFHHGGYNSRFDLEFLKQFFIKNEDIFFGSWFNYRAIDPLPILHTLDGIGKVSIENYKLPTVCEYYKIPIDAHDALSDITATRTLAKHICSEYFK